MMKYLFLGAITAYLISKFFPGAMIQSVISILCVFSVAFTFRLVNRFVRMIGLVFLSLGTLILIVSGLSWEYYLFSFGKMLDLLALFALLPILALPIQLGNYALEVQNIIKKRLHRSSQIYIITSFLSYVLSSFMNLATLTMMYYSIRPSLDLFPIKNRERFISRAITHGFSMPLIWTPVAPIVGIVVEMTGVGWASMLPVLIPLSLVGLFLDWITGVWIASKYQKENQVPSLEEWDKARQELAISEEVQITGQKQGRLIHIVMAILLFNILIFVVDHYSEYGLLLIVTLMVIPFSWIWSVLIGKRKDFFKGLLGHFDSHLLKMKDQFFVFLVAGFFISTIKISGVDHSLNIWISGVTEVIGEPLFLLLLPLIPFGLAFSGLHPAVSLALVAEALDPGVLHISSQILAVAMLGGAAASFLMGPYNATLGLMSNMIGESSFRISNWNAPFTFMYVAVVMVVVAILQVFM